MGIGPQHNGTDLLDGALQILDAPQPLPGSLHVGPRIGIRKAADLPYRFYLMGNPFVSR